VGETLIEERGAERDQPIVDEQVRVHAGRFKQHVPVPDRQGRRCDERLYITDPIATHSPEGLQRETLPILVSPILHLRLAKAEKKLGETVGNGAIARGVRRAVATGLVEPAKIPDHPPSGLGDQPRAVRG